VNPIEAEAARVAGWFRHDHPAAPPAATPPIPEDRMTAITDAEHAYAAAKAELAKFEQNLPAALAKAKQLESDPIAQVALNLAEHVATGFLPVTAVSFVASYAAKALADLIDVYHPQQPAGPTGQQAAQTGGQPQIIN
jgi:hypothetical protein